MRVLVIGLALAVLTCGPVSVFAQEKAIEPKGLSPLNNEDAWKLLPRKQTPLPAWARVLAGPLPKTTGAMLELDYLHRANNPLGPVLAAQLRYTTAKSLGSDFGQQSALADLRRFGTETDIKKITGDGKDLSLKEKAALAFARKMSRSAASVTDDEMGEVVCEFGPEAAVAIVHTLAYANFHNRIIMALGVPAEKNDLPPVDWQLDPVQRAKVNTPKRPSWQEVTGSAASLPEFRLDWAKQSDDALAKALEQQKARKPRIPLPDPSRFAKLPPGPRQQAEKIVWMTVSMGYQPKMTAAWFECLRAFQSEAAMDRVFSNSMFWVITRSNECFY